MNIDGSNVVEPLTNKGPCMGFRKVTVPLNIMHWVALKNMHGPDSPMVPDPPTIKGISTMLPRLDGPVKMSVVPFQKNEAPPMFKVVATNTGA
jgi:hypothetical protein